MDKQAPMCDNYKHEGDGVALVLWPSGKVQRFPSLAKAKTMLMRQHFRYIVCTPEEAHVYADDHPHLVDSWKMDDTIQTAEELWQYLIDISEERDPWAKAVDIPDTNRLSKRRTAAGYVISHEKCRAFAGVKAPKQAKVIAESFLEIEDGATIDDEGMEKHLHTQYVKGVLKTKQTVMRIFAYYRPVLLEKGCISLRSD